MTFLTGVRVLADPVTGEQGRRAAREELGRPEYHRDDRSLVQRFLDWLGDHLSGAVGGHDPTAAVTVLAVLVLIVVLIALWRAGALPGRRRRRKAEAAADPLAPDKTVDHAALASRLESEGRWAEALREWLRAAVHTLEDRAVLDPVPGRTGTRTAREAATRLPDAAEPLTDATSAFEQVWFGGRDATAADAALARQAAVAVREARITAPTVGGFAVPR